MNKLTLLVLAAAVGAAFATLPARGALQGDDDLIAAAQSTWTSNCSKCHHVPDAAVKRDEVWLDMVKTTAWSGGPSDGPSRKGLIAFLKKQKPAARVEDGAKSDEPCGTVTVTFGRGAILLVPAHRGASQRLVWKEGDKEKARPVPAGKYTVRNYVIEKTHQGDLWALSGTGHGPAVTVEAGQSTQIEIDAKVHLTFKTQPSKGRLTVSLMISGHNCMGLSILNTARTETDRRVPVTYALYGADDKEFAAGPMAYGWGGGASAACKVAKDVARAEAKIDTGPFESVGSKEKKSK